MRFLAALVPLLLGAPSLLGDDVRQDFRKQPVDDYLFRVQGPEAATKVRSEPEGLRITLRADPKPTTLGLHSRFQLNGDFEATVGYELLEVAQPKGGDGVGLEIYLNAASAAKDAIVFRRVAHPKEGQIFLCDRRWTVDGQRKTERKTFPAVSKSGQMRITRAGKIVRFWQAGAAAGEFVELCRYDWGTMDGSGFAVRALGDNNVPVDLRLTTVRIRDGADAPANTSKSTSEPTSEPPPRRSSDRLWIILGVFAIALALVAFLVYRRARTGAARASEAPGDGVSFFCARCGKPLRTAQVARGQAVTCPACGERAPVPEQLPPSGQATHS
jgi:DNA-directed RNA polymerase subunit RPC12/RpoP